MHLITGYNGSAHVTSANEGAMNARIIGTGDYIFDCGDKFSATIVSNSKVTIGTGEGLMNGRHFEVTTSENVTIEDGSAGKYRKDLICARYQKNDETGVEIANFIVIKGEDATSESEAVIPSYNSMSILDGSGIHDFPLYLVLMNGINLVSVTSLFTIRKDIVTDVEEAISSSIYTSAILYDVDKSIGSISSDDIPVITLADDLSNYEYVEVVGYAKDGTGGGSTPYHTMYCEYSSVKVPVKGKPSWATEYERSGARNANLNFNIRYYSGGTTTKTTYYRDIAQRLTIPDSGSNVTVISNLCIETKILTSTSTTETVTRTLSDGLYSDVIIDSIIGYKKVS